MIHFFYKEYFAKSKEKVHMFNMEKIFEDAEQGVLEAIKLLGDLYLDGYEENDIEPDLSKAIEYYNKAAEAGMEDAFMELGYIYCSGKYMQPDYEKGIACYERAADMGNTTALGNLGMSYCRGVGVKKDEKKGFAYFLKAAEGGHPDAMTQVARFYREGVGVEPNEEKAEYWDKCSERQRAKNEEARREKSSVQDAFEKNLEFISNDTLDVDFVKYIFGDTTDLKQYTMGTCQFKTGRIITADPLCYLQNADNVLIKAKSIKAGSYTIQVSVMNSDMVGLRIVGARMIISNQEAVFYELANCEKENQEVSFAGFPVECGMACFCDEQSAQSYWKFLEQWYNEHEDGNIYDDYFAALFAESYQKNPDYQREDGDLLVWSNPLDDSQIPMFATGLGDGYYTDYWGIDASGEICELVIIFMNPELF